MTAHMKDRLLTVVNWFVRDRAQLYAVPPEEYIVACETLDPELGRLVRELQTAFKNVRAHAHKRLEQK